jgi:hypothetical protein
MLLKHKQSGELVEVLDLFELTSPTEPKLVACLQWDEDVPDPRCYDKHDLCFPSGETLPDCWITPVASSNASHVEQAMHMRY